MKLIPLAIAFCTSMPVFAEVPLNKKITDREIEHQVIVNAPHEKVFDLWMDKEGIKSFFGVSAEIEKKVGGKYYIYFHPEDRRQSSEGAKILRYDPPQFLSFEWRGKPEMIEMNVEPLPTWVEVQFESIDASKTKVSLHHYGFGKGGTWDEAYVFFDNAWKKVLENLVKLFS